MQKKTYLASTKLEALLKIREEHGADAQILSERTVQKGKLLGKKPMVEIVVGIPSAASEPTAEPTPKAEPKGVEEYDPTQMRLRKLEREMQEIRALVQTMHAHLMNGAAHPVADEGLLSEMPLIAAAVDEHPLLRALTNVGVEQDIARELLRRVPRIPQNAAVDTLKRTLAAKIPVGGALPRESRHRQVAVLIGPTGVGKTTTIAKLAAIHALDYGRKVALLSLDTYRIGAIQQLRTYADLMKLPLQIATSAEEVQEGLEQFADYDLVLVDTIGRGQRDEAHLREMRQALLPVKGVVYLTLSATADAATLLDAAQRFAIFEPDAIILTKIDEAARLGNCVNLALKAGQPLSYFTTGQRVPEDICHADAQALACRVVGEVAESLDKNLSLASGAFRV